LTRKDLGKGLGAQGSKWEMVCQLAQAKIFYEHNWEYKLTFTNEVLQHLPNRPNFFILGKVGDVGFLFSSHCVPINLPICCHQIPNGFSTCCPNFQGVPPTCFE